MNCASNIITANFSGGKTHATTARVYQWSRGIELCITGADNLPQTFKAHFSVQKRGGVATTIVGIDERVTVPNVLFTIGKDIHVWLGASETEDDAEILYTVDIPVAPAPMPEYYDAEDTGVFDAVVEQVADYAATATAAANSAGASATAAAGSASAAAQSAASIEGDVQIASQKASEAQTAAGQAVTAKEAAQTSQTAAETAATNAGQSASTATAKASEAATSASGAAQSKTDAEAAAARAEQAAATLTVDSALSDSSTNPVQNKVITGEITDVKSALQYKCNLQSGYIKYNDGTYRSSSSRQYTEFPVSYGMSVLYSFNDGAAYNMGLAFYDVYGKYISGAIAQSQPQIVDVPEKAVLCKATARNKDDSVPIYLNSAIQKNRISAFKSIEIDNDLFEYQTGKCAYWNRATVASYSGINMLVFPVFEGLTFVYSLKNSNPNAVGLHFRNATGGYVSGVQATANPATVVTPPTATVCYASVYYRSEVAFTGVGNALLSAANIDIINCGLQTSSEPLETITDVTGMLDIFLHVGCIGDSLASGEAYWNDGGTTQGYDFYQYSWGQYLARKTGNTYYNWSKGGLTTKTWLTSTYSTECFDGQHLCEAYIIGLGQNDANVDMTIGTSSDIDMSDYNNNADSFYGNYGKIIQKIKEIQPQAKIFVITDPNTSTNNKGYNTPIRDMATLFSNVYVIDLQQYALKYMQSPVLIAQLRGGHFNAYGYKVFSMMIANYIDWIVTHDYTEFTQVELIGTGHSWT